VYGKTARTKKVNSVSVPLECKIIQDSGAFSDGPSSRLDSMSALHRQIAHMHKYRYSSQVTHMASYDLLIDEKWIDGTRHKRRWSEDDAWGAVYETVNAARYILEWRDKCKQNMGIVVSAQGVTPQQYLACTSLVLRDALVRKTDIFGLGGWCILGKMRSLMPSFEETIKLVVPVVAASNVKHIHIWGVVYAPALGKLLHLCDTHGITLSTDSAGPSLRPAMGEWGYMGWRDKEYKRAPVETRGLERKRHVEAVRNWLRDFRNTDYYCSQ